MIKQPFTITPKTITGKWTVGLAAAMPILFIIGTTLASSLYQSVPSGDTIFADIAARPVLALSMLAGMLVGISAFAAGLFAIIKQKENALLVYLSFVVGALLILFLAGEIISPH